MSYLILGLLSACITGMVAAHRRAEALETDRAMVLAQMRRPCPPSVDMDAVRAEMDRLEVEDLIDSLDEEV